MTALGTVDGRYELLRELGEGSQGKTYAARAPDGATVAVKQLAFDAAQDWKALELFEREIATLRTLDHVAIPSFVDAVQTDDGYFLVQEFIDGEALDEVVAAGPLSGDELDRCAHNLLDVLEYLHTLVPPVIHRDIKPANIIRRADGSHALVDFGGVQTIVASDVGGSTVIGTTGYMPSEQLIGRAVQQSDLYSLGATLVHLGTGVHPADLPAVRLKIDWQGHAALSEGLTTLIDLLLEPAPEDRPATAADARRILAGGALVPAVASTALARVGRPERIRAIERPKRKCPARVRRRFSMRDGTLRIKLGSRIGLSDLATVLVLVAVGALGTHFHGSGMALGFGVVCAVFWLLSAALGGVFQRFSIDPSGRYVWSASSMYALVEKRDATLQRLELTDKSLYVCNDRGERQDLTEWAEPFERPWIAWILQRYCQDGTLEDLDG